MSGLLAVSHRAFGWGCRGGRKACRGDGRPDERWRSFGADSAKPIPGIGADPDEIRQNQFTYDRDPEGVRCPFGAHVRRTNPRNSDFPGRPTGLLGKIIIMLGFGPKGFRDDLMSSVRYHRILRRGREYGAYLPTAKALTPAAREDPEADCISFVSMQTSCVNSSFCRTHGSRTRSSPV